MFKRSVPVLFCSVNPPKKQSGGRIQPIGVNLNQDVKKKLNHIEVIERIKKERKLQKNNRTQVDPIIKKAYDELEEEGFFDDKNREDY
ncbi:hypothetical protein RB653_008700 [Dictyostelium firmibasis]|uniref:Uncharacterized protein n=1 Tax=Dictyostelium firmibasis TaxID=79012 RepID=A0AAN7YWS9_9MYCE